MAVVVKIVRWTLSGVLAVVIWQNSHWSVAVALIMLMIAEELRVATNERREKFYGEMSERIKTLRGEESP